MPKGIDPIAKAIKTLKAREDQIQVRYEKALKTANDKVDAKYKAERDGVQAQIKKLEAV
jgi:hypothetical protein